MPRPLKHGAIRLRYETLEHPAQGAVPAEHGLPEALAELQRFIDEWTETCDPEIREMVRYQLRERGLRVRPLVLFACNSAATGAESDRMLPAAAAVEFMHNYLVAVNDIIDRRRFRGEKLALHARYGRLPALMVGGFLAFAAGDLLVEDDYATILVTELGKTLAVNECEQWNARSAPFGTELWRSIVDASSGGAFAACTRLATRDESLVQFGRLLGTMYHGCNDMADLRLLLAGKTPTRRDLLDRVLTLPAAIATENPAVASLYATDSPNALDELAEQLVASLGQAESVLDQLAADAERVANASAPEPGPLIDLIWAVRILSVPPPEERRTSTLA